MQSLSTPDRPETLAAVESAIYMLLIQHDEQRAWSVHEIELEIGQTRHVGDALRDLHGSGLIHRCGEFVWATRAALAADLLSQ
ncbi:MAG TPA: hypothetical protein VHW01_01830 [Polyangiaceae bacterium]|nr:hypothetical protein [Polyangiaceae bacterium]